MYHGFNQRRQRRFFCGFTFSHDPHPEETRTTLHPYFNHRSYVAAGFWGRREFIGKWRRIYARDPVWKPPHLPSLRRLLGELNPHCLWLEALSREPAFQGSSFELPVATAAVRRDPQHPDTGYLTLLHFVNDRTTLYVLLESLAETLRPQGVRTLIGPTHVLPHLGGGALGSHWHLPPPPDTPYGPPYAPEHLDALMSPLDTLRLFEFDASPVPRRVDEVILRPLELQRLADDLLPLLQAASSSSPALSPPGAAEARGLLRWLEPQRPAGFLATLQRTPDTPVGFVLLYPGSGAAHGFVKLAPPGARSRTGRLWGGVLPAFRRQGVGRTLLAAGLELARARGWAGSSVGPIPRQAEANAFLPACGGIARQRYSLYRTEL